MVVQGFCKAKVTGSNPVDGIGECSSVVERHPSKLDVAGSNPVTRSRGSSSIG